MNELVPMLIFQVLFLSFRLLQPASSQEVLDQASQPILLLSNDTSFHFELLVPLAQIISLGGDIGPILGPAKDITAGDFEKFSSSFYKLAMDTKAQAEDRANAYDSVNVRDTWFATATYFRRAGFYLHGNWSDPRIEEYWEEQISAFDKGLAAMPVPGRRVTIPADGFDVEAIWYPVAEPCDEQSPTLILGTGYDGSQEDMFHFFVPPALKRCWNVLTYEGPGQPLIRRRQHMGFIPDWERVVTPIVDYLLEEQAKAVDKDRLVLFGYSLGGYLAARAAAFEPRLSAVMLDGGIFSVYESFTANLSTDVKTLLERGEKEQFDQEILSRLNSPETPSGVRWGIEQDLWSFNIQSPFDLYQATRNYTIEGIVDQIKVPVWIADGEYDTFYPEQAKQLMDALGGRATYHLFNGTAGYRGQMGALQELNGAMYAWLHETLG